MLAARPKVISSSQRAGNEYFPKIATFRAPGGARVHRRRTNQSRLN